MRGLNISNPFRSVAGNQVTYNYPSLGAFINEVKKGPARTGGSSEENDADFSLSDNMDHAYRILAGENDKVATIVNNLKSLKAMNVEFMPQANKFSGRVSVPAMLSGVENCRTRFREEETQQQMVTLSIQINDNCMTPAKDFVNKATAVANAINNLEKQGKRVEVYGYSYNLFPSNKLTEMTVIKMKRFEDTLSIGQLYGLFAPSTFRRLWFRHLELFWQLGQIPIGYGQSPSSTKGAKGIAIPVSHQFSTLESAVKYVDGIINNELDEK